MFGCKFEGTQCAKVLHFAGGLERAPRRSAHTPHAWFLKKVFPSLDIYIGSLPEFQSSTLYSLEEGYMTRANPKTEDGEILDKLEDFFINPEFTVALGEFLDENVTQLQFVDPSGEQPFM